MMLPSNIDVATRPPKAKVARSNRVGSAIQNPAKTVVSRPVSGLYGQRRSRFRGVNAAGTCTGLHGRNLQIACSRFAGRSRHERVIVRG